MYLLHVKDRHPVRGCCESSKIPSFFLLIVHGSRVVGGVLVTSLTGPGLTETRRLSSSRLCLCTSVCVCACVCACLRVYWVNHVSRLPIFRWNLIGTRFEVGWSDQLSPTSTTGWVVPYGYSSRSRWLRVSSTHKTRHSHWDSDPTVSVRKLTVETVLSRLTPSVWSCVFLIPSVVGSWEGNTMCRFMCYICIMYLSL